MSRKPLLLFPLLGASLSFALGSPQVGQLSPVAPPPAVPPLEPEKSVSPKVRLDQKESSLSAQATAYTIGDPTDEETLYLEYINRARADAVAEATRLRNTATEDHPTTDAAIVSGASNVNFDTMESQFATLTQSTQPLAFNDTLITIARLHSQDQFTNVFQGHVSSSEPPSPYGAFDSLGDRLDAFGYNQNVSAFENVFSSAKSAWHGHAGFNIDWAGSGDLSAIGGMQNPPGHRNAIHSPSSREIGVGVVLGNRDQSERPGSVSFSGVSLLQNVGPQVVTQVFGGRSANPQFLTGVAFLDFDGDQFYSIGEGLGGVRIEVTGQDFFAETTASGAYAVPLPGQAGTYTVTISGPNITTFSEQVNVPSSENFKMDYLPDFTPSTASGAASPTTGQASSYTFSTMPGVSNYRIRLAALDSSGWVEGAETNPGNFTITQLGDYNFIQSATVASGSSAFHFNHNVGISDEILTIDRNIIPSASSQLQFQSRLAFATTDETARVDISTDGGNSWTEIFSQTGNNGQTDTDFVQKTVNLGEFDGQVINIRFVFAYPGGNRFLGTDTSIGWVVDDISITNSSLIGDSLLTDITSASFDFTPPFDGDFALEVAGLVGERVFPFGPALFVDASGSGSTSGELAGAITGSGGSVIDPAPTATEFFPTALEDTGATDWWFQNNLGLVQIANYPWAYHLKMGWMYFYGEDVRGFFVFIPGMGWYFTGVPQYYPYLYDVVNDKWLFFSEEFSTPTERWFYDFSSAAWMSPDT